MAPALARFRYDLAIGAENGECRHCYSGGSEFIEAVPDRGGEIRAEQDHRPDGRGWRPLTPARSFWAQAEAIAAASSGKPIQARNWL